MESTDMLRRHLYGKPKKAEPGKKAALDSAVDDDSGIGVTASYAETDIALSAAATVQQWAEDDDLDEGEGCADRLLNMMVGIADANKDGDITEDEQEVVEVALNAAWDYLVKLGVSEDDAGALLNDWDEDAAVRVRDLVLSALPEGDDAADADLDNFVFGADAEQSAFDSALTLDAAYKKFIAIRKGKKVRIKKRVSGTVRLSAKQKLSIRKARMKSHSAKAQVRRFKSMKLRSKMGM